MSPGVVLVVRMEHSEMGHSEMEHSEMGIVCEMGRS